MRMDWPLQVRRHPWLSASALESLMRFNKAMRAGVLSPSTRILTTLGFVAFDRTIRV